MKYKCHEKFKKKGKKNVTWKKVKGKKKDKNKKWIKGYKKVKSEKKSIRSKQCTNKWYNKNIFFVFKVSNWLQKIQHE